MKLTTIGAKMLREDSLDTLSSSELSFLLTSINEKQKCQFQKILHYKLNRYRFLI